MASIRVHKTDSTGKPVLWSVAMKEGGKWIKKYFSEEKEAKKALLGSQMAEIENGSVSTPLRGNLDSWVLKYKALEYAGIRPNTQEQWENTFKFLARNSIEQVQDLTTDRIALALSQECHLKPNTKNGYLMKIGKFVRFLQKRGMNVKVDVQELRNSLPKRFDQESRANKEFLSLDEFQKISDWFAEKKFESRYLLLQVLASFGFRINELLKSDITDLKDGVITIRTELEKTHKKRFVRIPAKMEDHIRSIREKFNTKKSDALFICEQTGGRLHYRTMQKWWRKACKELEIKNKPIHRLRALGFYVLYESSGHDMLLVKEVCGWQSDAFKYYSSSRKDKLPTYFAAIGGMLGNNIICDELNSPISKQVAELARNNKGIIDANDSIDRVFFSNLSKTNFNSEIDKIENFLKLVRKKLVIQDI